MKALIATKESQGWRKNDFCHCNEGEYVTFGFECDKESVDGKCGCRRSLVGFDSSKATTTFRATKREAERQALKLHRAAWPDCPGPECARQAKPSRK